MKINKQRIAIDKLTNYVKREESGKYYRYIVFTHYNTIVCYSALETIRVITYLGSETFVTLDIEQLQWQQAA